LRISKCHPFNPGGVDLVPSAEHSTEHPAKRPADKNSILNNRS
jgi:putative component of membrane protein insertase Oxa1/YidC/SpoIIIJ protein YidD